MQDGCILCRFPWYALASVFVFCFCFLSLFLKRFWLFLDILNAETVPVRTVNRQCSSGLQAVADVAAAIKAGFYDIGTTSLSVGIT